MGDLPLGLPGIYTFEEYAALRREQSIYEIRNRIGQERPDEGMAGEQRRGLLDFHFRVPAGQESAFTTIFGQPEVNLRVNGMADMSVGTTIQKTWDPALPPDQQLRVDPAFHQNLQLNIQGTVGDKLTIQTDWDTERMFDYQNRLRIVYEGYEDEIIRSIEMGNVSVQTGNSLIRGSGSLFGIKAVADVGALRLTSILSQQKGERNVETITGGAQEQSIRISPADYENDRHFFLDFYTRQEFERSLANPHQPLQTLPLSEINVWLLGEQIQTEEGARLAVALADYGVVRAPDGSFAPPDERSDRFDEGAIATWRDPSVAVTADDLGLEDPRDFEEGYFRLLYEGEDYTVDRVSGYISLNRALSGREVLAVSYTWQAPGGEIIHVGDVNPGGGGRIFLKMLRPASPATDHTTFPLTMRNVYSIGATGVAPDDLELEIFYTEENVASNRLPGRLTTLLQDLGLDRTDREGALAPDNQIDFGTGTFDAWSGRIVFPWLEPFGSRLDRLLEEAGATPAERERLVFEELYLERQQNAARSARNGFYRLEGRARGGVQENFTLDFALVEGSVRVFANGIELLEGIDYQVDYSFGSVTILNDRYRAPGQEIRIEYESQAITAIEQKSFAGLAADYRVNDRISLGGTWLSYHERPLDDKIRIGDEPVSNMVFGFHAHAAFETPFITRALDAFPLLSASDPSEITFSGEFARLLPGVSHTRAVKRALHNGELYPDEEEGLSFIDDFEGSSIRISLLNPMRWHLAATPAVVPGYPADRVWFEENLPAPPSSPPAVVAERADLRGKLAWYTIPRNIGSILDGVEYTPESQPVRVTDVFPGRKTWNPREEQISTLDLFFDPTRRGPYNYNRDLRNLLENEPERTWGGMTAVLPSGQEDFSQNNVEFLEFWVQPLLPGGREGDPTDLEQYDGRIYIDIGTISEDVVPNGKLNTEDGLALNPGSLMPDRIPGTRSWLLANPPPPEGEFSAGNRELEDVGLDGVPSAGGYNGLNERLVFSEFLEAMAQAYGPESPEYRAILEDPSNDNYRFYGEPAAEGLPLHERFHRMLAYHEGNTPLNQQERRAVTNRPNTEGLVNSSRVELNNAYFQYELAFNPADPERGSDGEVPFIVDQVTGSRPADRWYQVRIPLEEFTRKVGEIHDFQNISYVRIWMSGYRQPFTLRFATLEFAGSQWERAEQINRQSDPAAWVTLSTVNIEENSNRQPIPYRQPRGGIRAQERGSQLQSLQNEQSIQIEFGNVGPGAVQMIKRNFPGGINLLNYSNLRMFVHGEGFESRGDAELVVRLGNDLENNYYEYRQPVTPTDPGYPFGRYDPGDSARLEEEAEEVWLYDVNSINIVLGAFNQLKQLRDREAPDDPTRLYERSDLLEDGVPGALIAIRGNPSLDRVTEIGIGVYNPWDPENPTGPGRPRIDGRFWVNELRVSGFDNESGWAANARTTFNLADFATVHASMTRMTDGFGSLDSRLGQRRMADELAWDIHSTIYMDRFIPERYGWNIPLTLSSRRSTLTPRYLPDAGDIRLSDFMDAVHSGEDPPDLKQQIIDRRIREIQTYTDTWSVNLSNVSKSGSNNPVARWLIDPLTFNYVFNTSNGRNPQYRFQDNWNFTSSLRYQIDLRSNFIRPFAFTGGVPVADLLSGLELGLLPNRVTGSVRLHRNYEERRRRNFAMPDLEEPLQQIHNFNYETTFGFGHQLTRSITTNFQTQSGFDLSRISQRPRGAAGADSLAFDIDPTFDVLGDLVSDPSVKPRRATYQESYTASWQPRLEQIRHLEWVSYSLRYGGGFRWENSPFESGLGARVSNSLRLDHQLRLETGRLFGNTPEGGGPRGAMSRALQTLQSLELSYSDSRTGSQAGYTGGPRWFDQLGTGDRHTPSFGWRTGFESRIGRSRLVDNPDGLNPVQLPLSINQDNQLQLIARLLPSRNLSIDLEWFTFWDERESEFITIDPDNSLSTIRNASGNNGASVWSFGPGYRSLFERQLQTAFDDLAPADTISDALGNRDGRTVMNRITLQEDFRNSYLGFGGTIGRRDFTPLPMPGWRVNWMGLEEWVPLLGRVTERITLTHAYSATYRLGWIWNSNPGELPPRRIGYYAIVDERPELEPASVNIEKRFAPLLRVTIAWDSNLRTQLGYEYNKLTSLALSNINVTERISKGITASVTYTFRNFRLPLLRRLTSNLDLTVNGNYMEDTEQRFLLESDIDQALSEPPESLITDPSAHSISPRPPSGQSRIQASTIVGYRFSNTVQANFSYGVSHVIPKSSRTFQRTTHDLRFNIRINIRS